MMSLQLACSNLPDYPIEDYKGLPEVFASSIDSYVVKDIVFISYLNILIKIFEEHNDTGVEQVKELHGFIEVEYNFHLEHTPE